MSSDKVAIQLYSRDDRDEARMDYGIYSLAPAALRYARKLMEADPSTYTDDVKAGVERYFSHWGARCAFMDEIRLRVEVGRLYNTKRNPPPIGTICAAPARPTHAWPSRESPHPSQARTASTTTFAGGPASTSTLPSS